MYKEKTAEELFRFAIASRQAGRLVEARANLELSIDKKPTFDAFVQLIEIAFEQERFADAADLVVKARLLVERREQKGRLTLLERGINEQLERINREDGEFKKLVEARDAYGLIDWFDLAPLKGAILKAGKPSLRLVRSDTAKHSRIGGKPLLDNKTPWPETKDGKPLAFLCQIALADLRAHVDVTGLPTSGLLSFFAYFDTESEEEPFSDESSFRVLYFPDLGELSEYAHPGQLPAGSRYRPVCLKPREEMSFPENLDDDALDDYPDGADAYFAFYDAWNSLPPHHRMLGHANVVQDDPVRASFLQSRSLTEDDLEADEDGRLARALDSYKLLLQLEPDQDAGLAFGDGGTIYFCIDALDLAALRFEKARAILQLY
ncbi:MAG: YwqG family protein [Candidatus Obscuribacterales bacterium]